MNTKELVMIFAHFYAKVAAWGVFLALIVVAPILLVEYGVGQTSLTLFLGSICACFGYLASFLVRLEKKIAVRSAERREEVWKLLASQSLGRFVLMFELEFKGYPVYEVLVTLNNQGINEEYKSCLIDKRSRFADAMGQADPGSMAYERARMDFQTLHTLPSWRAFFKQQPPSAVTPAEEATESRKDGSFA